MTNSSLITVFNGTISNQAVQLCNARDLHAFLESKYQYTDWIKARISDYGFIQDEDYIIVTERTHGRPRKEYHITLDMGKELGMVERNERGRQIRKFFIECERKLKEIQKNQQLALPEPEPTINVEFKVSELRKIVNVWLQFTRFAESVYFLIRALGLNNDSAKHDERSVVFNHNLCKQNIKDTTLIIKRLALQLPEPPKRLTKPNF